MKARILVAILIAAIAGSTSGYFFRPSRPPETVAGPNSPTINPNLHVSADSLQIGNVWEQDHFSRSVVIENSGPEPIRITEFSTSCNCATLEPRGFTLAPGASQEVKLSINLKANDDKPDDRVVEFTPKIAPAGIGPTWIIRGRVRKALSFVETVGSVGRRSNLDPTPISWSTVVESRMPLSKIEVDCNSPYFSAAISAVESDTRRHLRVSQIKSIPPGDVDAEIAIVAVATDHERLPIHRLSLRGLVLADVQPNPPAVCVSGRKIGDAFEEEVVFGSLTSRPIEKLTYKVEGDGLVVSPSAQSGRLLVRQQVLSKGFQRNLVRVSAVGRDGRTTDCTVVVEYTGLD